MIPGKRAATQQIYDASEHTIAAIAKALRVSRVTIYRSTEPQASASAVDAGGA